ASKGGPATLKTPSGSFESVTAFARRPHARLKITAQGSFLQGQAEALPARPQEVGRLIPAGDAGDGIKHGPFGEARLRCTHILITHILIMLRRARSGKASP